MGLISESKGKISNQTAFRCPGHEDDEAIPDAVNDKVFEMLRMDSDVALEIQLGWKSFLDGAESREAAGEAIYGAFFNAAGGSLQSLFKTPRAAMSMHILNGLSSIVMALSDPKRLKNIVETLGIRHLDLKVNGPRVNIIRNAIVNMLVTEMGARLSQKAIDGFVTMLNYVGGAFIYIRRDFADSLTLFQATRKEDEVQEQGGVTSDSDEQTVDQTEGTVKEVATGTWWQQLPDALNDKVFEELRMDPDVAFEIQLGWKSFLDGAESREAAGAAIYGAIFDAMPPLQNLFKTPRAAMSMHILNGLSSIIGKLSNPKDLKGIVETLGTRHLDLKVNGLGVIMIRNAIVNKLMTEMGERLSPKAIDGFNTMLNYVGGAFIYIHREFADRLTLIRATRKEDENFDDEGDRAAEGTEPQGFMGT